MKALLLFALVFPGAQDDEFDVVFSNGTVIDGTGAARFKADVGVKGSTIAAVGDLKGRKAGRTVDIAGKIIAPGYIDLHSHADEAFIGKDRDLRRHLNGVHQGITTVVVGQDGRHLKEFDGQKEGQIAKLMDAIQRNGVGSNVAFLFGHDNIRQAVLGRNHQRFSTPGEVREMAAYVEQYMKEGAFGMSLGLEYASGKYSDVEELVALAQALGARSKKAVIIAHERATGPQHRYYLPSLHNLYGDRKEKYPRGHDVLDYAKEGIRIAEESGIVFDFSHIKITHRSYWGKSREFIDLVEAARRRGVRVYAEHHPLTVTGNSPMDLEIIPSWAARNFEGVLADERRAKDLRLDVDWEIQKQGGWEHIEVLECDRRPEWVGKSLEDLGREWGLANGVDVAIRLRKEGDPRRRNGARLRTTRTMSDEDLKNFCKTDWCGTITDGGPKALSGGFAQPRYFCAFTIKITEYVKKEKVITLEHAIRAGTGLPAEILSLPDRGRLKPGFRADLQVFDFDELEVRSKWSLTGSRAYSAGMYYVMVEGTLVLDDGQPTDALPGAILRSTDAWK